MEYQKCAECKKKDCEIAYTPKSLLCNDPLSRKKDGKRFGPMSYVPRVISNKY